ncbi:MAG: LamG domain-containing protein [Candidatus Solibacter usitatus]|nr:LamG domain-containing protein [Candidatus Solibacter usitatus]
MANMIVGVLNNGGTGNVFGAVHQSGGREPHADGGTIPLNTWTHVAMTFDSATGLQVAYVNGRAVNSTTSVGAILSTSRNVLIGREDSTSPRYFNGLIDEVAIFNRALSAAEILSIFSAGTAGKCKTGTTPPPPPPTGTFVNFGGRWNTEYGPLTITQTGASVTGVYPNFSGTIAGTVAGNILTGTWTQGTQNGGIRFVQSADGNSFTGTFTCAANCQSGGNWSGTRAP